MKKIARLLFRVLLVFLVLVVIAAGVGWWTMRGSLATLDGELGLAGLSAPVQVQRDDLGNDVQTGEIGELWTRGLLRGVPVSW